MKLFLVLILPLLGVAGLIAQTEYMLRQGQTFRVDITGYDPSVKKLKLLNR